MSSQASAETNQPLCIKTTLRIMGDKWTGRILDDLSNDINTFSALEESLSPISPRTLSQRLDMLEKETIVVKEQYCERPPRFKYVPTDKGIELQEVISKMAEWGAKYHNPDAEIVSTCDEEC